MSALLIHFIRQHKYSHGGLITKIWIKNGIDVTKEKAIDGKAMLEKNFKILSSREVWDEEKAIKQREEKKEKSRTERLET